MNEPSKRQRRFRSLTAERDAAYRKALGLDPDIGSPGRRVAPLPSQIGTQASAGGARGGRGASNKGKGRNS